MLDNFYENFDPWRFFWDMTVLKIVYICSINYILVDIMLGYVASESRYIRDCVKQYTELVAASADDIMGILKFTINNFIVLLTLSCLFCLCKIFDISNVLG